MRLIERIPDLKELEQQASPADWEEGGYVSICHAHKTHVGSYDRKKCRYEQEPIKDKHGIRCLVGEVAGNYDIEAGGIVKSADLHFICALRNAAPALLAVADKFREGDERCLKMIRGLVLAATGPDTTSDELDCLTRLAEAAAKMEEEQG